MASPHVAAACAMVKSLHKNYSVSQVYNVLKKYSIDLGPKGKDIYYGNGFINLKNYYNDEQSKIKTDLSKVTLSKVGNKSYTGKEIKPSVKATYKGKTLKNGTDYTISYSKNKNVGTAIITLKGKGNYKGSKKITFKIKDTYTIYRVKPTHLNYRKGAGTNYKSAGYFKKNQKIITVNKYDKKVKGVLWKKVYYKKKYYYVNSKYLKK
ncbi:beta-1,4-endoglucanase V [Lachnospiraceae bacterium TWA4]|nr:beta-1,4-endoglucanase V [Lachnospiraceae bacterium TWA4]